MAEKKTILITGANGLVGNQTCQYFREKTPWNIIGTSRKEGDQVDLVADLTNPLDIERINTMVQPDAIIHTAAIVGANLCEKNHEICYTTNVVATANLCQRFPQSFFIYFSTYAVYDTPTGHCDEHCSTFASNYYIQTKLEAEEYVKKMNKYLVLRPSVIFGYVNHHRQNNNYLMQLLNNIQYKKVMHSPRDQYFNPIFVDTIVEVLKKIIELNVQGIYNIGSNEDISKYEFNCMLMEQFGFDRKYLEGVDSDYYSIKRPKMGTISSEKIQSKLHFRIPPLVHMVESLYSGSVEYIERYLTSV